LISLSKENLKGGD